MLLGQTLISTAVILITGEFVPKTVFGVNPNRSLKIVALPIYIFYIVLYPISLLATWLSRLLMKILGVKDTKPRLRVLSIGDLNEYLDSTIDELEEKKTEVEHEVKIFRNALDFSSTRLRDCMTPRNELVAVNIDSTDRDQLVKLFTESGRSKMVFTAKTSTISQDTYTYASFSNLKATGTNTYARCCTPPKTCWPTK